MFQDRIVLSKSFQQNVDCVLELVQFVRKSALCCLSGPTGFPCLIFLLQYSVLFIFALSPGYILIYMF